MGQKNNIILAIAFIVPLLVILALALRFNLPNFWFKSDYNFVYTSCNDDYNSYYRYDCPSKLGQIYKVENGRLTYHPLPEVDENKNGMIDSYEKMVKTRIFLHDTKENTGREITLEEAQGLLLSGLITAPDGVSVSGDYVRNEGFFPFFSGYSTYGQYLTKGNSSKRLNLINESSRSSYDRNFQFIGWVIGK